MIFFWVYFIHFESGLSLNSASLEAQLAPLQSLFLHIINLYMVYFSLYWFLLFIVDLHECSPSWNLFSLWHLFLTLQFSLRWEQKQLYFWQHIIKVFFSPFSNIFCPPMKAPDGFLNSKSVSTLLSFKFLLGWPIKARSCFPVHWPEFSYCSSTTSTVRPITTI